MSPLGYNTKQAILVWSWLCFTCEKLNLCSETKLVSSISDEADPDLHIVDKVQKHTDHQALSPDIINKVNAIEIMSEPPTPHDQNHDPPDSSVDIFQIHNYAATDVPVDGVKIIYSRSDQNEVDDQQNVAAFNMFFPQELLDGQNVT